MRIVATGRCLRYGIDVVPGGCIVRDKELQWRNFEKGWARRFVLFKTE